MKTPQEEANTVLLGVLSLSLLLGVVLFGIALLAAYLEEPGVQPHNRGYLHSHQCKDQS